MWSPPSDLASISSHVADVAPALAPLNFGAMEHLAAYDSSDDDADEPADPPAKRNCPAPLPPPPLDGDTDDAADAALVRQFPHVDGNFAAHVFLTVVPAPALQQAIDRAVAALGVHRLAEYHVSLSRTFVLRRPQIGDGRASQPAGASDEHVSLRVGDGRGSTGPLLVESSGASVPASSIRPSIALAPDI